MSGAENVAGVAREVAIIHGGQGPSGMGATVDKPARCIALADDEAGKYPRAFAKPETLTAGIGDLAQGAKPQACGRSRRVVGFKAGQGWP